MSEVSPRRRTETESTSMELVKGRVVSRMKFGGGGGSCGVLLFVGKPKVVLYL